MIRHHLIVGALMLAARAGAVEYIPVYNGSLMGGQYFLKGSRASLSGNAALAAAPTLRFSDRWSLMPVYAGNYQGTKGVNDGVASGTLFQQQMDHRVSATGIYSFADTTWRAKSSLSYRRQFLKETLDETWGQGLFDFEKIALGFEMENVYQDPFSYRVGFDVYRIRFPSFQSLEADAGVDPQGAPLGRERSSRNVLDTWNYQLSFSGSMPYPRENPVVLLQGGYSFLYQVFRDQRLVGPTGQFADHKPHGRQDYLQTVSGSVSHPRPLNMLGRDYRFNSSIQASASYNGSNQNTFDAARAMFVFDSYSYYGFGLGPNLQLAWGDVKRPSLLGLSFLYNYTRYVGRQAQDADGRYTGAHQWQDRYTLSLSYSYPIVPGFSVKVQNNWLWATSNNVFEKTYLYTYRVANYLMGFTYEY